MPRRRGPAPGIRFRLIARRLQGIIVAVDAVVNPDTGGIVCRSTLTDPTNGCVPINLFGYGAPSEQAINYVTGTSWRKETIKQQVADLVIRGTPFSTWAGPVSVAAGAQWRRQTVGVVSDPIGATFAYRIANAAPYSGSVEVKEAFGEMVLPLLNDQPWAKNLELNVAGRVTDYSTSGSVYTWKAGLNYQINDSIRLRTTRSRDIRAPNLEDLFLSGRTSSNTVNDRELGLSYLIQAVSGGNRNLTPEKADTFTAGVVLSPSFARGLNISLDYYDIKVDDAIATLTAANIVTRCFTNTPSLCSLITRGSDGRISTVAVSPANFQTLRARGIDAEVAYRIPVGKGRIDLHGVVSYLDKLALIDGGVTTEFVGNTYNATVGGVGGSPRWRFRARAGYTDDLLRLTLTSRFTTGGDVVEAYNAYNGLQLPSQLYFDLSGSVNLIKTKGKRLVLFGVVTNLMDKDPPATGAGSFGTPRAFYDTIGRRYTLGLRFTL